MAGFLEHYGEGDAERARLWKRLIAAALIVLVVSVSLFLFLRNRRQKERVREFVSLLQRKEYPAAYALWGCTESTPCPTYPMEKFLADWGPEGPYKDLSAFEITRAKACGSGVMVYTRFGNQGEEILWVEGDQMTIGFAPWPVCPP